MTIATKRPQIKMVIMIMIVTIMILTAPPFIAPKKKHNQQE